MSDIRNERRRYTRVAISLPVEIHQGGSVWKQQLIDISLAGAATDQPDVWDAQYNEPFSLIIHLDDSNRLELHAYLQHVEANRLGFTVEHVDKENIEPLLELLNSHSDAEATFERELQQLKEDD